MPKPKLSRGELLTLERRDNRELRKYLRDLVDGVSVTLAVLDGEMAKPSDEGRGRRIAKALNALNLQNDIARRFGLGQR
jgi:hypothetical protein